MSEGIEDPRGTSVGVPLAANVIDDIELVVGGYLAAPVELVSHGGGFVIPAGGPVAPAGGPLCATLRTRDMARVRVCLVYIEEGTS